MFEKYLERKYKKEIRNMSSERLLKEYFNLRSNGNILLSMNIFEHDDIKHWKICEDYLINIRHIDGNLLDRYTKIYVCLHSGNIEGERKEKLKEDEKELKEKLILLLEEK